MNEEFFNNLLTNSISLIIVLLVYTAPVLIYRFAINKKPLPKKKAVIIALIYGVIGTALAALLYYFLNGSPVAGFGLLFWGYINYSILIQNDKKTRKDIPSDMLALYEKLSTDSMSLDNDEMKTVISDFKEKASVFDGEYGKYNVSFPGKRNGLNGLLIVDDEKKKIFYFSVFMETKPSIYIDYKENMTMYYLDCEFNK